MKERRDGTSVQEDAANTGKCIPKWRRLQPEFIGKVKNLVNVRETITDVAIRKIYLHLDSGPPLGNRESRNGAPGALIYFFSTRRDLREDSIAQQRSQDSLGILFVDIFEQEFVHVRFSIQGGEEREPLALDQSSRVAIGARDGDT